MLKINDEYSIGPYFSDHINRNKGNIFLKPDGGQLRIITFKEFENLNRGEKITILEKLNRIIIGFLNLEVYPRKMVLFSLKETRNAVFSSLNKGNLPDIPFSILEECILKHTSPKDVENVKGVCKKWARGATHKAKILSINQGLRLKVAVPPKVKTAQAVLDWLKKDEIACKLLTYADFGDFSDFNNEHLKELVEICPHPRYLSFFSSSVTVIKKLPPSLEKLSCGGCENLEAIHHLPPFLKQFDCSRSCKLKALPQLPETLQEFGCSHCPSLKTLPDLPASVQKISLHSNHILETIPKLPQSLCALSLTYCPRVTFLPDFPESLISLVCYNLNKLVELPMLPQALQELRCMDCPALTRIPNMPFSLEELSCARCFDLSFIPAITKPLKMLDITDCHSLNEDDIQGLEKVHLLVTNRKKIKE